jgi:predicted aminopeptidase
MNTYPRIGWRLGTVTLIAVLVAGITGCESLGYYSQAAGGQIRLLYQRQDVNSVLGRLRDQAEQPEGLSAEQEALRRQLELSRQMLSFAERELFLDVEGRYRSYVALDEPSVVWNLFAAPELSLEPRTWCYPFVGCAPYRGYFKRAAAERYQQKLQKAGYETHLGGVAAYSTLGWFDDPLLSSFIHWSEANLADLLFHELAHSRVWLKGDVAFNEAFASFVGRRGMEQWLRQRDHDVEYQDFLAGKRARANLTLLLDATKTVLQSIYQSDLPDGEKSSSKTATLAAAQACFSRDSERYGGRRYSKVMSGLNNALLVSIATYDDHVPAFAALFEQNAESWPAFYRAVRALSELPETARHERLTALAGRRNVIEKPAEARSGESQIADQADDRRADQVQCEALFRHRIDADSAGAEDDDVGRGRDGQHERA